MKLVQRAFHLSAAALIAVAGCGTPKGSTTTADDGSTSADPAAAVATAPSLAPAVEGDPMGVIVNTLPNGLTVMLSENHEAPRITAWITTRAGSMKDPAVSTGMAHYLEHMLFKGTTRLGTTDYEAEKPHLDRINEHYDKLFETTDPEARAALYKQIDDEGKAATAYQIPNEFDQLYDNLGFSGLNAFTNNDQTSYTVNLPANRLEQWAMTESERLRAPVFRLFQSELEAVYEEMNQSLDSAARLNWASLNKTLFPQHPYGTQPTIGTVEHLKNPSIRRMYEFFETWYVPGNLVIALAGDFDAAEALDTITRHFGSMASKDVPSDPEFPLPPVDGVQRIKIQHKADDQITLAWKTVANAHADYDALVLCDMMLDNSQTGLINVNINQEQLCRSAGSSPTFFLKAGMQTLRAVPKPGQTLEECEALLLEQVALLKQGAFTDDDLAAVMTDFELQQKRQLESNDARVREMTQAYLEQVDWSYHVHSLDRLRALTKEDVIAAANKYLGDDYVVVLRSNGEPDLPEVTKPSFTAVKIEGERRSDFFNEVNGVEAEPIAPQFAELGRDYQVLHTWWGTLYHAKNPLNDLFDVSIHVEVGTADDARLHTALDLFALAGAGDLDPLAYKRRLYALGSQIGGGSGERESTFSASGLDTNFAETVALMKSHFTAPSGIAQDDLNKLVQSQIGQRTMAKTQSRVVNSALQQFALRGKQSPLLAMPTNDALKALTAEDLIAAAGELWGYKRIVTYSGRLTPQEVAAIVAPEWGSELKTAPSHPAMTYEQPGKNRVLFVDDRAAQAQVGMFSPDGVYSPKQVPPSRVYNEYMSGSMGAVVFQEVREARSLAYSAWTNYTTGSRAGDANVMRGALGTQADKTLEAIDVLLGLIRKMPAQPARIDRVRSAIDESYRTRRLTFRAMPGAALTWQRWGLDSDPRRYNWQTATSMDIDGLTGFSSRFTEAPFTITVVGNKEKIDLEKLKAFGEVIEVSKDDIFSW